VNLYNANIDRKRPLSKGELVRQLAEWEAAQGTGGKRRAVEEGWGETFGEEFGKLTRLAREGVKRRRGEGGHDKREGEETARG
jgi:hypothetical protein